jgi:integrase
MATVRKRLWADAQGKAKTAWFVDYYDSQGKRRRETFATRRAADFRRLEIENELKAGTHVADGDSITVSQAARDWLQRGTRLKLARGSMRVYDQLVRRAIEPDLGAVKLSRLTAPMVEIWAGGLLDKFSLNRARRILSTLGSVVAHAKKRGKVGANVVVDVEIEDRPRLREKLTTGHSMPSIVELHRLLDTANAQRGRTAWLYPMVLTAAYTGLRKGELRGLSWGDVDLVENKITVRIGADQFGVLGTPKSPAAQRIVPLAPDVVAVLREWKLASGQREMVFPGMRSDSQSCISPSAIDLAFAKLQRTAGVVDQDGKAKYVFHRLRHFYASAMISTGVNIKWLQATIGHKRIALTIDHYGHLLHGAEDATAYMAALQQAIGRHAVIIGQRGQ